MVPNSGVSSNYKVFKRVRSGKLSEDLISVNLVFFKIISLTAGQFSKPEN